MYISGAAIFGDCSSITGSYAQHAPNQLPAVLYYHCAQCFSRPLLTAQCTLTAPRVSLPSLCRCMGSGLKRLLPALRVPVLQQFLSRRACDDLISFEDRNIGELEEEWETVRRVGAVWGNLGRTPPGWAAPSPRSPLLCVASHAAYGLQR
jgi:hypothetical protein